MISAFTAAVAASQALDTARCRTSEFDAADTGSDTPAKFKAKAK